MEAHKTAVLFSNQLPTEILLPKMIQNPAQESYIEIPSSGEIPWIEMLCTKISKTTATEISRSECDYWRFLLYLQPTTGYFSRPSSSLTRIVFLKRSKYRFFRGTAIWDIHPMRGVARFFIRMGLFC
jgi:hypothetical protein